MESVVKTFENREDWLAARRKGIGASEAAVILELSPWDSRLGLFARKRGLLPEIDDNEAMRWGRLLEAPIAKGYSEDTKRTVEHMSGDKPTMFFHPEHKFLYATPDGFQEDGTKGRGLLEIKTAMSADGWADGEPPEHYQVQIQHQLAVTGLQWGTLAVLVRGRQLLHRDIDRNDRFISAMIRRESEFWKMVQTDVPPEPKGPGAREALQALYPKDSGEVVELPGEYIEVAKELLRAQALEKESKARVSELQNRIKAQMGQATEAILPDGTRYRWRTVDKNGYVVQPSSSRRFQRLKG